ncbi:MAG: hypothetical protein AAFV53_33350 [Myxococcota bacterium]
MQNSTHNQFFRLCFITATVVIGFSALPGFSALSLIDYSKIEHWGSLGDSFGSLNAIFTGSSLIAVVVSLYMQRSELALQREQIAEQTKMFNTEQSYQEKPVVVIYLEYLESSDSRIRIKFLNPSNFDALNISFWVGVVDEDKILWEGKQPYEAFFLRKESDLSHTEIKYNGPPIISEDEVYACVRYKNSSSGYFEVWNRWISVSDISNGRTALALQQTDLFHGDTIKDPSENHVLDMIQQLREQQSENWMT